MDYSIESKFNEDLKRWEVDVFGEIDIFNSQLFKESINEILLDKEANLFINCENLEFIDSTALGVLVSISKKTKTYGGEVLLYKLRPSIEKLFKITNLDKVFKIEGVI